MGRRGGPIPAHQPILTKGSPDETLAGPANRHRHPDRGEPGGVRLAPCNPLNSASPLMAVGSYERMVAHDIIEVHGAEAAGVARGNARSAALAGQPVKAKAWIRVLG